MPASKRGFLAACPFLPGRIPLVGDDSPLKCPSTAGNLRHMSHLAQARKVFNIELAALKAVLRPARPVL